MTLEGPLSTNILKSKSTYFYPHKVQKPNTYQKGPYISKVLRPFFNQILANPPISL